MNKALKHIVCASGSGYILLLFSFILCVEAFDQAYPEEAHIYESHGKRDPFVPLVGITSKVIESLEDVMSIEDVNLQGLAYDASEKKFAIINGELIREGQTIGRLTVKKISLNNATLDIDEVEYQVNLYVDPHKEK